MDTKAEQGAAAQGPDSEAKYGPALCVWCGATLVEAVDGEWDAARGIAAAKEHVQKCQRAPWGKRIAALEEALHVELKKCRRCFGATFLRRIGTSERVDCYECAPGRAVLNAEHAGHGACND